MSRKMVKMRVLKRVKSKKARLMRAVGRLIRLMNIIMQMIRKKIMLKARRRIMV